ncbi:MAG: NAD-reducing hydrogenase HoxS subunit beta [Syntrophorhabdus sp. PtaU1.Bin058]|nr:MAG: NAD-reducing hydrogenase HoxS subunit beta [Syntrophorhabdus sp. PtaU1.Bin058]
MGKKITINPVTRLEGHGKIDIFLNDNGDVEDAYFQVTELRGFERFCIGRPAEEMPRIVPNICGVCPTPHNMASTKALDYIYGVAPTPTAKLVRRLQYNANFIEDHYIHFFFLAAPDFVVGPDANPAERNILGVINKVGLDIGKKVIDIRKRTRDIIKLIASKPAHPEGGLPGGVPRGITEEERREIRKTADMSVDFALFAMQLFKDAVLKNKAYLDLILSDAYNLKTYYMGLVDDDKRMNFYEGRLRIVDPSGNEVANFHPNDYTDYIGEWVEPWTYIRLTHLKKIGWKGLIEGDDTSLYRVGPLARYNVVDGMATPLAQKEYEEMVKTLGKPAHHTLAFHWARLIEALQAAENLQVIANDPLLTSKDIRNMNFQFTGKGIGCVEACRGVLIHHYETDDRGLINKVNLIVATQHNAAPIALSVKKAAQGFIKGGEVKEGMLNMAEMAFRAYDPCLGCATHTLPGKMPLEINIRDRSGAIIQTISRGI